MNNSNSEETQSELELVIPASWAANALKYGPYKTSANAIAELVDNSYDADAKEIHVALICGKVNKQPLSIAVLDNGRGMDKDILRRSIQFGNHQDFSTSRRPKIGKFGVGLFSASVNQCQDLEVYSWTNGLRETVNSTKINFDKCPHTLPEVTSEALPDFFEKAFFSFDRESTNLDTHGTLIVWRNLDNLSWKRAETLKEKLQQEIGRIYRNFLVDQSLKVVITIIEQDGDDLFTERKSETTEPVDPLFLSQWNCNELQQYIKDLKEVEKNPNKYGVEEKKVKLALEQKHLFVPFDFENETDNAVSEDGTVKQAVYTVTDDDGNELGKYRIIASYRRPQTVRAAAHAGSGSPRNPGDTKYGKLAERLRGVSIMRGSRELTLDTNWLRADSTTDRWLALSFDFDPSLDKVFGVSNDKQMAKHLASLAQVKIDNDDELQENHDPDVLQAAKRMHSIISNMRLKVRRMDSPGQMGPADDKRPTDPAHENIQIIRDNSMKMQKRAESDERHSIKGVDDQSLDPQKLKESLKGMKYENKPADAVRLKVLLDNNLKYDIVTDPSSGSSDMFVPINNASGAMIIRLNSEHPLYQTLQHIIGSSEDEEKSLEKLEVSELINRLYRSLTTTRRMIIAYSRAELEHATSSEKKDQYESMRRTWSKIARDLIEEE